VLGISEHLPLKALQVAGISKHLQHISLCLPRIY
jgi:hypothetical protein